MSLFDKLSYQLLKLLRMAWFSIKYSFFKWKKIEGIFIPVNISYGYSVLRFINNGEYEQGEITIIKSTLKKEDVVLELGTGMGFVSAFCSKQTGNENVYTFEANSSLKETIDKLYKKNNVRPKLTFAMLGETAGIQKFYRNTKTFLASSSEKSNDTSHECVEVTVLSLNDTIRKIQPTYLMMDIEGGESDIFNIIDFQSIKKIQFELHPAILGEEKVQAIFNKLRSNNFSADDTLSLGNNFFFRKMLPEEQFGA
jgi:FkbM family methyltransferase